jgi:hypothetical protein
MPSVEFVVSCEAVIFVVYFLFYFAVVSRRARSRSRFIGGFIRVLIISLFVLFFAPRIPIIKDFTQVLLSPLPFIGFGSVIALLVAAGEERG